MILLRLYVTQDAALSGSHPDYGAIGAHVCIRVLTFSTFVLYMYLHVLFLYGPADVSEIKISFITTY